MIVLELRIRLLSDAELGTGLGNEAIDDLVPRNARGEAHIPATHVRGLLRDRLELLASVRGWSIDLAAMVLGEPGGQDSDGNGVPSPLRMTDASSCDAAPPSVLTITRTAVSPVGAVVPGSLRTVEAIPAGSQFKAELRLLASEGSVPDLATRLGLMAIEAMGSGRTRGAGRCCIQVGGESRRPGALLHALAEAIAVEAEVLASRPTLEEPKPSPGRVLPHGGTAWLRLAFRAEAPVCCPETPINGSTNHIRTGPVIPASAVQGAIITRLDRVDPQLATACLNSPDFRAWPMVPVMRPEQWNGEPELLPFGIRVDLTHRMSKLADEHGDHEFRDPALSPYHWMEPTGASPLRASDGVLRWGGSNEEVELWRSADIPRMITAHGVHHDASGQGRRNLFSVEALAPLVFVGLVAVPEEVVEHLRRALSNDPFMTFGRARRVGGHGALTMEPVDLAELLPASRPLPQEAFGRVFVVQSPVVIPDDLDVGRAETTLKTIVEAAGWGKVVVDQQREDSWKVERTAAACGVRFGWNRHGVGDKADDRHRRLRARRVILPGSVFVLEEPLEDLPARLLRGLGEGREQGYGAVLPHPGLARSAYRSDEDLQVINSTDAAGKLALELFNMTKGSKGKGPSPSQIGALAQRLSRSNEKALELLRAQKARGSVNHWHRWRPVFSKLESQIASKPKLTQRALRAWQDLVIIHRPDREER